MVKNSKPALETSWRGTPLCERSELIQVGPCEGPGWQRSTSSSTTSLQRNSDQTILAEKRFELSQSGDYNHILLHMLIRMWHATFVIPRRHYARREKTAQVLREEKKIAKGELHRHFTVTTLWYACSMALRRTGLPLIFFFNTSLSHTSQGVVISDSRFILIERRSKRDDWLVSRNSLLILLFFFFQQKGTLRLKALPIHLASSCIPEHLPSLGKSY